jgi:hypothetical protein
MDSRDQEAVIRALRKDPYGAGVAELIGRGHLRDAENYRKILEMCKKGPTKRDPHDSMVPAAYMALTLADELQNRGATRLGFEFGRDVDAWDVDVYTRDPDGSIGYGYQLKNLLGVNGIKRHAPGAAEQLATFPMRHRVVIMDVHTSLSSLDARVFGKVEYEARIKGVVFWLRFEDGAVTIPANGRVMP